MSKVIRILSTESDLGIRRNLEKQLKDSKFAIKFNSHSESLLEILHAQPHTVDILLMDMDEQATCQGPMCLDHIKENPDLHNIPIILQTDDAQSPEIHKALRNGAYHFLHKNAEAELLQAVIFSALENRNRFDSIEQEKQLLRNGLAYVEDACFKIRTLDDIKNLTALLCSAYPDPDRVTIGIHELLTNAIEHGNLDISYEEKSQLIMNEKWREEVEHRLTLERYTDRYVYVHLQRTDNHIDLTIRDEGRGFNSEKFLDIDPARMFDPNGRGIAVARSMSFDALEYNGKGNEVTARILLHQGSHI